MKWRQAPRRRTSLARSAQTVVGVIVLAAPTSCGERGLPEPETLSTAQTAPPSVSASEAMSATDRSLTYVSASPGTFPNAVSVSITNLNNGASVRVVPRDDGFDPIALAAAPGDALEIVVGFRDGSTAIFGLTVPVRRPPRVVRTRPPKGATDVVLNATVTVVFSEPVDASTVTGATVQLRLDGSTVEGILTLSEDGLQAELVPTEQLRPDTSYTLAITRGVRDLDGDLLDQEVLAPFTTLSPPVLQLAFTSRRDGNEEIDLINVDGTGQVNLTPSPGNDFHPAWSRNGAKIAFTSDRDGNEEIYVMNADGTGQVNLTRSPGLDRSPAWSPDGRRIAFTSGRDGLWQIYVMNPDGTDPVNLTNRGGDNFYPVWSPDGFKVAFQHTSANTQVYLMNRDGAEQVNLSNLPWQAHGPAWSPDGQKIAFNAWSGDIARYDILVINADGTGRANLTRSLGDNRSPAWSPDGSRIAFVSDRDGNDDIYVMNADGTGQVNLTRSRGHDAAPQWSFDGSKIAFASWSEFSDRNDIWVMNADGTGRVNLTNSPDANDTFPEWRPQR